MAMTFGRCGSSPTPTRRSHADGGRGGDAARPPRGARVLRRLPQPRAPREVADDDRPSRIDCGIGAGWHDVEAKAFGFEFPRIGVREDMLEEYAQCLRRLFAFAEDVVAKS